ncbi:MAG: TraR/DksA family transcriptional regulator [Planctomycetota bacterium]|jgi:DnaK suppressor protein
MSLSADERTEIRKLLEELAAKLEARMDSSGDQADPVKLDEPIGRLSRMDAIQMQQMAKAGLSREQQQFVRARYALSLIDDEDFGDCQSCKQPIGIDRLRFQPEILLCVRCV